jgi:peptidoglycan/xylan/chitin deacetylase (PgdA/CDA1 family)
MKESLRKMVKLFLALLTFYSGFLNLYLYLRRKLSSLPDFTILMYHRVLDVEHNRGNHFLPGMVTLESTFDKQMKYLKNNSNVISLNALIGYLKDKENPPPRSIIITFDDGWRDNYLFAFPILKKYDLPVTIFLSTDYIGTSKTFWLHVANFILQAKALTSQKMTDILNRFKQIRPEEKRAIVQSFASADVFIEKLKRIKPEIQEKIIIEMIKESNIRMTEIDNRRWMLDWEEIKKMGENQIFFGSHGHSHRILTYLNLAELKKELTQSKRAIEEKTKRPANFFAYPNGDYTPQIKELVKETGYLCGCTVEKTRKKQDEIDLFALPRIGIHEGMSTGVRGKFSKALFACQVAGLLVRRRRKYE